MYAHVQTSVCQGKADGCMLMAVLPPVLLGILPCAMLLRCVNHRGVFAPMSMRAQAGHRAEENVQHMQHGAGDKGNQAKHGVGEQVDKAKHAINEAAERATH